MAAKKKLPKRDKRTGRFLSNPYRRKTAARKRKAPAKKKAPARKPAARKRKAPAKRKARRNPGHPIMSGARRDALEMEVDKFGLGGVLDALARICFEKAEHLQDRFGDTLQARPWSKIGHRIDPVSLAADNEGI